MQYEYDAGAEAAYSAQLLRAFRKAAQDPDQHFRFLIGAQPAPAPAASPGVLPTPMSDFSSAALILPQPLP